MLNLGECLASRALRGSTLPHVDEVIAQTRRDGAVLCKETGVRTVEELRKFLGPRVDGHVMPYFGGTNSRTALCGSGDVLDTGTEPPHIRLREHAEMAYVDLWPGFIIFGCLQPPENAHNQGQTTLLRTAELASRVPARFLERLSREGLRHKFRYSDAHAPASVAQVKSWQATLSVTTRAEVENICSDRSWASEWAHDGTLTISYTRPAFARHPSGDSVLFVTDLTAQWYADWPPFDALPDAERPYSFGWGAGEAWSAEDGALWAAAADACRYKHAWEAGEVLIVDNMLLMHGRERYSGPRKLGVVLAWPVSRTPLARL